MSLGLNLKTFRHEKGLTQKDLADKLFVTAQAVSRWENDEVEPSIDMLKTIADLLDVKVEELIYGRSLVVDESKEEESTAPMVAEVKEKEEVKDTRPTVALCVKCGKKLYEGDRIHYPRTRSGRSSHHTHYNKPSCESCHQKEMASKKKAAEIAALQESRKRRIHGYVWGSLAAAIVLGFMLSAAIKGDIQNTTLALGITYSILSAYAIFALIFTAILDNNFIGGMFGSIVGFSVRMPGLIFSLDLDGIIWFLTVKLVLFILGIIGTILLAGLAIVVCGALSMFVFPFALRKSFTHPEETGLAA